MDDITDLKAAEIRLACLNMVSRGDGLTTKEIIEAAKEMAAFVFDTHEAAAET